MPFILVSVAFTKQYINNNNNDSRWRSDWYSIYTNAICTQHTWIIRNKIIKTEGKKCVGKTRCLHKPEWHSIHESQRPTNTLSRTLFCLFIYCMMYWSPTFIFQLTITRSPPRQRHRTITRIHTFFFRVSFIFFGLNLQLSVMEVMNVYARVLCDTHSLLLLSQNHFWWHLKMNTQFSGVFKWDGECMRAVKKRKSELIKCFIRFNNRWTFNNIKIREPQRTKQTYFSKRKTKNVYA